MPSKGSQTEMPRAALPRDAQRSERVVWGVALALAVLFALGQVVTVLAIAPAIIAVQASQGSLTPFVLVAERLGPVGLAGVLLAIDALVLALFVWLARRYWIGFVFLPPVLYLGIGSIVIWLFFADLVPLLVAPTGLPS